MNKNHVFSYVIVDELLADWGWYVSDSKKKQSALPCIDIVGFVPSNHRHDKYAAAFDALLAQAFS
ncbi:MAG: hypothetical protein HY066_07295 [Betaproteobacteria bacterium]|nr:hypothetical protein [Betaproteobacteria bacterium]